MNNQRDKKRENWCLRHINDTNFYDIFFTDETTFYLDNPAGAKWLKDKYNFIYSKNKERKLEHGVPLMHTAKLLSIYLKRI